MRYIISVPNKSLLILSESNNQIFSVGELTFTASRQERAVYHEVLLEGLPRAAGRVVLPPEPLAQLRDALPRSLPDHLKLYRAASRAVELVQEICERHRQGEKMLQMRSLHTWQDTCC